MGARLLYEHLSATLHPKGIVMKSLNFLTVTKLHTCALKAVKRVQRLGDGIVIADRGKPAAVLIAYEKWVSITETPEIKQDRKLLAQIQESLKYLRRGGKNIPLRATFRASSPTST